MIPAGRVYQARTGCPSNPAKVTSHVSTSVSPVATGTTSTRISCRRASASVDAQNSSKSAGAGAAGSVALELVEREVEQRHGQATVAGGAVLSRITSSVPSSMRGLAGASPRAMASTIRVAVAAIS